MMPAAEVKRLSEMRAGVLRQIDICTQLDKEHKEARAVWEARSVTFNALQAARSRLKEKLAAFNAACADAREWEGVA